MIAAEGMESGVRIPLFVVPGASRERVLGEHDGCLRVSVTPPPEAGAANKAVIRLIASLFEVRRSAVRLERGAGSRRKSIHIEGITLDDTRLRLGQVIQSSRPGP